MNRNLGIFLGAVALATMGSLIGRALTDADLANATPKDAVITLKGASAKVTSLQVYRVTAADGGAAFDIQVSGSFTSVSTAADGGVESETVTQSSPITCRLPTSAAAAASTLLDSAGLVCFRQGFGLER